MKDESRPQYARVEQPFGVDFPTVHCPICGKATTKSGDDGPDPELTPCKHLAFIYVGEVGGFEYTSADFNEKTKNLDFDELDPGNLEEFLKEAGYGNNLLVIELTHGGMACGPVWFTDVFGFDYDSLADKRTAKQEAHSTNDASEMSWQNQPFTRAITGSCVNRARNQLERSHVMLEKTSKQKAMEAAVKYLGEQHLGKLQLEYRKGSDGDYWLVRVPDCEQFIGVGPSRYVSIAAKTYKISTDAWIGE